MTDPSKVSAAKSAAFRAPRDAEVRGAYLTAARRERLLRFLVGFGAVVATVLIAWPLLPRRYDASSAVILHASEQDEAHAGLKQGILDDGAIQSEMDRMSSPLIVDLAMSRIGLASDPAFSGPSMVSRLLASVVPGWRTAQPDPSKLRDTLRERMSVVREKRSYTLRLTVWDRDADRAAAIANALVEVYIQDQIGRKREAIEAQTRRLEQRAALLRSSHQAAKGAIRAFMSETGISDRLDGSELQGQLTTLSNELAQARARSIEARVRFEALTRMQQLGVLLNAPEVVSSPSVQRARDMYAAARAKPANLAAETNGLQAQVEEEARRVVHAADQEAASWRAREDMLRTEVASVRADMVRRRLDELRLDELRREAASDETALTDALAKLKAQLGRTQAIQPDADLVARAERPRNAAFPNAILAALGTLLLASVAGFLAAARPGAIQRMFGSLRRLWGELSRGPSSGAHP